MLVDILSVFAIICVAIIVGKLVARIQLPAILGWLITGIIFGPYLVGIITTEITDATWYQIVIKFFECFAGVMIGKEIIFKKIAKSGKQIIGITFIQSIATFLVVSAIFAITFAIANIPIYLSFIFGGIALATAPAPALSIVNEYKTDGPVTKTLIPLAAIDDIIGVVIFFATISIIGVTKGGTSISILSVVGMVLIPFIIGIAVGSLSAFVLNKINKHFVRFMIFIFGLLVCIVGGLLIDIYLFGSFSLNYL